jgi:Tetrapyrrole (Corrin/Porphyrin) Methylases
MPIQPHIVFAGAGPGDPGLVTMRLVEILKSAECILTDRLVNPEIITLYANKQAEIIFVGKQGYQKESTDQKDINSLLIQKAISGLKAEMSLYIVMCLMKSIPSKKPASRTKLFPGLLQLPELRRVWVLH